MENNKEALVALIGQKKYDEEIAVLEKIKEQEGGKWQFEVQKDDIDTREQNLLDKELHYNFNEIKCGLRGAKLSGGQKQRVAIARTIIRKPKVLLLDEATSALDEDSQKLVQKALETVSKGKTTIIIAHRMSTIENCDKIFVLDSGKVKEEGNFDELKNKGGYFTKLREGK